MKRASAEELSRRSDGTRWTNRQLLFHMVFGYLIVRTLMPLVHLLGRLGWSRRLAATLNSLRGPFHVINYLGSACGGQILSPTAMTRLMDRTVQVLQRRLAGETDHSLNLAMHFPPTWDPLLPAHHERGRRLPLRHPALRPSPAAVDTPSPRAAWSGDQLLVTSDCPHREAAEHLLRTALAEVGLPTKLRVLTVTEADDVALQGFRRIAHLPREQGRPVPTGTPAGRTQLPHLPDRFHVERTS